MERYTRKYQLLPALMLVVGAIATWITWNVIDAQIQRAERVRFTRYSDRVINTIRERLSDHERLLEGGRGLFYASKSVEFDEWRAFAKAQNLDLYPGILGVGYIVYVPRDKLDGYVARVRKEEPDFQIKTEGNHPDLFVIQQIEPVERNRAAWGLDTGKEANRRAAAEESARSGLATLTKRITLVQDKKKIAGFLMLLPMYRTKSLPENPAERMQALFGWTYVPIRIEELMEGIVSSTESMVDFEVLDGENAVKDALIYDADGHISESAEAQIGAKNYDTRMFHKQSRLEVEGRVWTIFTSTRSEFERTADHANWVLPVGILLTLLAALAVWSLSHARRKAESLAEAMTLEVREREERWHLAVSGSNAGIWDWDLKTDNVYYSPRWVEIMGVDSTTLTGNRDDFLRRLHPDDAAMVKEHLQAHFSHKAPTYAVEYRFMHGDGSYRWVAVNGQAQWDAQDRPARMVGSTIDISERKQAESDLRDSEGRMRAIVDSASDAIVVIDEFGCIQSFNLAAEQIFGYSVQEVLGKNVSSLMPEPYRSAHAAHMQRYLATGEGRAIGKLLEFTGQRKDGAIFPLELAVTRIARKDKIMFTGIVRDITERQKIDRMKHEFVSTVSHELRTPLTSIRGSLGLIAGGAMGEIPSAVRQLIDIAYNNSERLVRLINDILDIEKIESGKISMTLQVQPIMRLIDQALEANRGYAEQYGVRFVITHRQDGNVVKVDSDRFMQVMANLLSNAAKFSPRGGVVSVGVVNVVGRVRVSVNDQGSGIPVQFRDKIFQKFTQADSSDTRKKGGTGLGLAICKALVECMNGSIGYDTQIDGGTTFYFDLPAVLESNRVSPTQETLLEGVEKPVDPNSFTVAVRTALKKLPGSKPRILHIEDDPDIQHVVGAVAGSLAEFEFVPDLKRARESLGTGRYDLVILDLALPDGDGWALLPMLNQIIPPPPVLVFSSRELTSQEAEQVAAALVKSQTSNQTLFYTVSTLIAQSGEPDAA